MSELGTFALYIGAALVMGTVIGLERQIRQHPAGLRTNALVCVGAALFVSLARMIDQESSPTRIAAQVVSGIGFLGGGVILREGLNVRGMTTAATLWCSAAIGTLAGLGFLAQGAIGVTAILVVNLLLRPLIQLIDVRTKATAAVETCYRIRVVCASADSGTIRAVIMRHINSQPPMTVQGIFTEEVEPGTKTAVIAEVFSTERNDKYLNDVISRLSIEPCVSAVSWEKVR